MRARILLLGVLLTLGVLAAAVSAAPSLPITKPPVLPTLGPPGPANDQIAQYGQWFRSLDGSVTENRTHEFYDNVPNDGGGNLPTSPLNSGYLAIKGIVTNVQYNGQPGIGNITAFNIQATITNDTPGIGPWRDGTNAHGETLHALPHEQYTGNLYKTKLTAEFAYGLNGPLPPSPMVSPYYDRSPRIAATNHDQLAWYCWTPGSQGQTGDYYVPTWDFGDIPQGASVSKLLTFTVDGAGLAPGVPNDYRYGAIQASYLNQLDIFFNRTTDLKIGDWMETLLIDAGTPYAEGAPDGWYDARCGNVSVFHQVPEPSTLALLVTAGLGLLICVRRRCRR